MHSNTSTFFKTRATPRNEDGFTLIELLVVILIIGILAAIAIPTFLNQREKGQDACAISQVRTMATAMETFFAENNSYAGASIGSLNAIESAVTANGACGSGTIGAVVDSAAMPTACSATDAPSATGYCVVQTSRANSGGMDHTFVIRKAAGEPMMHLCEPANQGGCKDNTW